MDTRQRRENLAARLEKLANDIRLSVHASDFDLALGELFDIGSDCRHGGYHGRTLSAMYDEESAGE